MSYAENTSVPADRSRAECERILTKYGADQVSSGFTKEKVAVMFRMRERYVRITMPLPIAGITFNKKRIRMGKECVERETRRRWRAMVLYIKAKLESIESEIVSFDTAFMGHLVLPNSQTVSEFMQPQIEAAYKGGAMPKQLPGY